MEWPKELVYVRATQIGKSRILSMCVEEACRHQLKTSMKLERVARWFEELNGVGYYAKTKGKQPRTVFVRKRGDL